MDCVRQLVTASSVVGPRRSSKALSKAKLAPEKGHGHCLVVCCPSDPLQLSESWWNHYIWEVGSANQWDAPKTGTPATGITPQKGPSSLQQCPTVRCTAASEVEHICLICHIYLTPRQPTTTFSSVSTTFAGKMLPRPAGGRKCFPRVRQILKHGDLHYRNKQTFLISKNVLIVMVLIFINKDVFESSYNDLSGLPWWLRQ